MSKYNKHNEKKLKDLLNNNSTNNQDAADEFEKAAKEGFAMLENEEEAIELKNAVDAKIYSEVFLENKEKTPKIYWLAAAALIGIIGFSVYFFQSYFELKEDKLAIQQPSKAPDTEKIESLESLQPQETFKEPIDATSLKEENKNKTIKTVKGLKLETSDLSNEKENSEKTMAPYGSAGSDIEIKAEPRLQQEEMKEANNEQGVKTAQEDLPAASNVKATKSKKTETDRKKNEKSEDESAVAYQKVQESDATESVVLSEVNTPKCYYEGGDEALIKDLYKKLQGKDLLYSFDAVLFITNKAKIEKVTLTTSDNLSEEIRNKLIVLIKGLNKFKVSGKLSKAEKLEYRIEFRP